MPKSLGKVFFNMFVLPICGIAGLCLLLFSLSGEFLGLSLTLNIILGILLFIVLSGLWIVNCLLQYSVWKNYI